MQAVILAAGMGTRMGDLTAQIPKPMLTIKHKPILEHVLNGLPDCIDEAVIVTSSNTLAIFESYFGAEFKIGDHKVKLLYAVQRDDFAGTYGALHCAKELIKVDYFLVLNGDDIIDKQSLTNISKNELAMGFTLQIPPAANYFIFTTDKENKISEMRRPNQDELSQPQLISTGTYTLSSKIWDLEPVLTKGNEYGLPQTLQPILQEFRAITFDEWHKVNTPEDLEKAATHLES
jgi:NDP-sugar pyrophosphorylase family protein